MDTSPKHPPQPASLGGSAASNQESQETCRFSMLQCQNLPQVRRDELRCPTLQSSPSAAQVFAMPQLPPSVALWSPAVCCPVQCSQEPQPAACADPWCRGRERLRVTQAFRTLMKFEYQRREESAPKSKLRGGQRRIRLGRGLSWGRP